MANKEISDYVNGLVGDSSLDNNDAIMIRRASDGDMVKHTWANLKTGLAPTFLEKVGGTLTGDITLDKSWAAFVIDSDTSTYGRVEFKRNGVTRWTIAHDQTSADVFYVRRYDNTGAFIDDPISLNGDALSFAQASSVVVPAATAFTHAANGMIRGTGSPEGVVTANVGMKYIDTSVTNGAMEWMKVSGGGNTGWRVTYGDTGWRDASGGLGSSYTVASGGVAKIRRVNNIVELQMYLAVPTPLPATADVVLTIPAGFVLTGSTAPFAYSTAFDWQAGQYRGAFFANNNIITFARQQGAAAAQNIRVSFTYSVVTAWPTSLPSAV